MPLTQPELAELLDQGDTYRCGPFSDAEWWTKVTSFASIQATPAWRRALSLADSQHGMSFGQVDGLVTDLGLELGIIPRWFGYIEDFPTLQQVVRDGWCVVVGIYEQDVVDPAEGIGPQRYFHFIAVDDLDEAGQKYNTGGIPVYHVADPFHKYDGEDGVIAVPDLHQAIRDNWDPIIIGIAWRFD